jgi:bifunctional ADP-heptose synthase (sugar kinase/adenylyltransferase)
MNIPELLEKFAEIRALVVGDIRLDRWCEYDPALAEPSRETGIPRVGITATEFSPGAGGTIAGNMVALGAGRVAVIGAMGQDGFGFELRRAMAECKIDCSLAVASGSIQTVASTRFLNANSGLEDMARCDSVNTRPLPADAENQLIANFNAHFQDFDVILVSDQAEGDEGGVITAWFRDLIGDVAERYPEKVVVAGSRQRIELFRSVIANANHDEAVAACARAFGSVDLSQLRSLIGAHPLIVTQGPIGALLVDDIGERLIPAERILQPADVCCADGTFAAGMALALRASGDFSTAIRFGNLVSSIAITKSGADITAPEQILARAAARLN